MTQPYRQTRDHRLLGCRPPRRGLSRRSDSHRRSPLHEDRQRASTSIFTSRSPRPGPTATRCTERRQVVADVSSATGWHRELVLAPPRRAFAGDRTSTPRRASTSGTLRRIERAFTNETGLGTPDVTLQVTWKLHVLGEVDADPGRRPTSRRRSRSMLTPVELLPARRTAAARTTEHRRRRRSRKPDRYRFAAVARPHVRPSGASAARTASRGGSRSRSSPLVARRDDHVLALGSVAAGAAPRQRTRSIARYRYLLVNAATLPLAGRRPVVLVDTMRDLARLAKLHEELIVHADAPGLPSLRALHRCGRVPRTRSSPPAVRVGLRERRLGQVGTRRTRSVRSRAAAHVTRGPSARHARRACAPKSAEARVPLMM